MSAWDYLRGYLAGQRDARRSQRPAQPSQGLHVILLAFFLPALLVGIGVLVLIGSEDAGWMLVFVGGMGAGATLIDRWYRRQRFHDTTSFVEEELRRRGL